MFQNLHLAVSIVLQRSVSFKPRSFTSLLKRSLLGRPVFHLILAACLVELVNSHSAFAYLDPGSISMALQVVVAAVAGGLMFFKTGWSRIKGFFNKGEPKEKPDTTPKP